jgi:ribosomal-protein-serine acetyltransferase
MSEHPLVLPERLETERLVLRRWRASDVAALRAAVDASDAHLRPWIPWMRDEPRTLPETAARIAGFIEEFDGGRTFGWALLRGEELVGEVMLMARAGPGALEIGYWLHARHIGCGYAREAVSRLVALADGVGIERLEAWCAVENGRSSALVDRLGFGLERIDEDGGRQYEVWVRRSTPGP